MSLNKIGKVAGLGAVIVGLSAGAAFAATATATVNVRSGPGTGYGAVDVMSPGEFGQIVRTNGSWCYVQKAGPDGWVSCGYLTGGSGRVDLYTGPDYYAPPPIYVEPSIQFGFGFGGYPHYPSHMRHPGGSGPWPHPPHMTR